MHDKVDSDADKDQQDVLIQSKAVSCALSDLGHETVPLLFSLDIRKLINALFDISPDLVFNLVETVNGRGSLIHIAPAVLDFMEIAYTGSGTEAIFLTSNKLLAKNILKSSGIFTPRWLSKDGKLKDRQFIKGQYIIKSVWEHASIGLDQNSLIFAADENQIYKAIQDKMQKLKVDFFSELYIEGREYNISLIKGKRRAGLEVFPPSEIRFIDYPEDKPKIVDYRAKWEEESFEYRNTLRSFDFPESELYLLQNLVDIAKDCWNIFGIQGYARIDFRVDQEGMPWVLEVNANPCLSPDSGFVVAAKKAGLSFEQLIDRIINIS